VYYDPKNATARSEFSEDGESTQLPLPYAFASPKTMDSHGGWIASALDMARFAAALDKMPAELKAGAKPLLTEHALDVLYERPRPPVGLNAKGNPADVWYACGWNVRTVDKQGHTNIWHNGAMPGTSTLLVRLANGHSWVVLFNQRADGEGDYNIDALLHAAAAKVVKWPE